jgi:hypothetical protein
MRLASQPAFNAMCQGRMPFIAGVTNCILAKYGIHGRAPDLERGSIRRHAVNAVMWSAFRDNYQFYWLVCCERHDPIFLNLDDNAHGRLLLHIAYFPPWVRSTPFTLSFSHFESLPQLCEAKRKN